jgi:ArsR family transcriptional regulator, arsenate/arsenite/antimonite-responsive transcriptional repressor
MLQPIQTRDSFRDWQLSRDCKHEGDMIQQSSPKRSADEAKTSKLTQARRTAILKALADPRRFELLERISRAGCPLGCAQAQAALAISPATLSHHVKELETAGLIEVERAGRFHYLRLKPGVLGAIAACLASMDPSACDRP